MDCYYNLFNNITIELPKFVAKAAIKYFSENNTCTMSFQVITLNNGLRRISFFTKFAFKMLEMI